MPEEKYERSSVLITGKGKIHIFEGHVNTAFEWKRELLERGYEPNHFSTVEAGIYACVHDWPDIILISDNLNPLSSTFTQSGLGRLCSELYRLSVAFNRPLPIFLGTIAVQNSKTIGSHFFDGISSEVMPMRLQKPIKPGMIADTVDSLLGRIFEAENSRSAIPLDDRRVRLASG